MAKTLIIDAHHHWMPEEHYGNPDPLIRAGETVVRRPDRLAIRREGVQLFGPPAMTADMAAQIDETDVDDSFRRKNLRVLPLPTRAFLIGQEMGLYFEVYNLMADEFGQTRYRVTIQIAALEQVEGLRMLLTGQEVNPEVSMSFEQVDTQPSVQVISLSI